MAPERDAEPARETLTPPRVSTGDWPVDEAAAASRARSGKATAPEAPAPMQPAPAAARQPCVTRSVRLRPAPVRHRPQRHRPRPPPAPAPAPGPEPAGTLSSCGSAARAAGSGPGPDVEVLRRAWPEILQTLTKIKRSTWALVEPNAQVGHFEDHVLTLAFTTSGLAGAFGRADHSENLRQAIHKTIGIECQITAVASGSNSAASSEPNPKAPVSRDVPATSTDADWGLPPAAVPAQPAPAQSAPADPEPPHTARAAQASPTPASAADPAIPAAPAAQAAPPRHPLLRPLRRRHPFPRRRPPLRRLWPPG